MPDADAPYTIGQVKEIAEALERQPGFADRNTKIRARRLLRKRQRPVNHPRISETLAVYSPVLNRDINLFTSRFAQARLRIDVREKKVDERELANNVKQLLMRSYIQTNVARPDPPFNAMRDRQTGDGVGWGRLRLDPKLDQRIIASLTKGDEINLPRDLLNITGVPFVVEAPDPLSMYYNSDFSEVAEVGFVTKGGYHPGATTGEAEARKVSQNVKKVIRLSTENYSYDVMFDTKAGKDKSEKFVTVRQIFGGPEYYQLPGIVTGDTNPADHWQCLVADLEPLVIRHNLLETMLNNAADMTGAPLWWLKKGADPRDPANWIMTKADERPSLKIDTGTGEVEITEGWEPMPLSLPSGIDLIRALELVREEMREAGYPRILMAPQEIRAASGYDRGRMQEATGNFIEPPLAYQAAMWKRMFEGQLHAIKQLGTSVTVRTIHQDGERNIFEPVPGKPDDESVTVTPEDLVDIDMEVMFSSETDASRIAWQEEGNRLLDANRIDLLSYLSEYRRAEDPYRARELIESDRIRQAQFDAMLAYVAAVEAEKWGTILRGGRPLKRRPPAGEATEGVGATLVQPATPRTPEGGQVPALGEEEGVA